MSFQEKLNLFLLVLNSNFAIVTIFLLFSTVVYIVWQSREQGMRLSDWAIKLPLGIAVAIALSIETFGNLVVRVTVTMWRFFGGGQFDADEMVAIGTGSAIGLFGLLMLIRSTSKPRFGERVWLAALLCAAVNTAVILYVFIPD